MTTTIQALTELTTPVSTDIFAIVDDPAGTAVAKKITLANIMANAGAVTATSVAAYTTSGNLLGKFVAQSDGANSVVDFRVINDAQSWAWEVSGAASDSLRLRDVTGGKYPVTVEAATPTDTLYLGSGGQVILNGTTASGQLTVNAKDATTVGLVVNTAVSPTADIASFEVNGATRSIVNARGSIIASSSNYPGTYITFPVLSALLSHSNAIDTGSLAQSTDLPLLIYNRNNSAVWAGLVIHTRQTGSARAMLGVEWQATYQGDLFIRLRDGGSTSSEVARFTWDKNLGLNTTDQFGSGSGVLALANAATNPSTTLTNAALLYASGGELYAYDSAGNATLLSPHNDKGEWVFYSRNSVTGREVKVNMEQLVRAVEEATGKKLMEVS